MRYNMQFKKPEKKGAGGGRGKKGGTLLCNKDTN